MGTFSTISSAEEQAAFNLGSGLLSARDLHDWIYDLAGAILILSAEENGGNCEISNTLAHLSVILLDTQKELKENIEKTA